jgi:hypothetical protein
MMNIIMPNKTVVRQSKSRMVKRNRLAVGGGPAGGRERAANSQTSTNTPMQKDVAPMENTTSGEPLSTMPQIGRSGSPTRIAKAEPLVVELLIFGPPAGFP